ncbi:MAG: penicillin-binding protein 1C, partial [Burkholderiaceae bacterium]
GSADYFDRGQAGALDFARTPRSPGSTLKPFFYALALERGQITPATILDDLPVGVEGIANADRTYLGPLLPRQALANSRNIPMARMLKDMGVDEGYSFLRDLDLHHNEQDARHYGLGLTIGAMPVTLEHLVQAYSVLANDGKWRSLNWYPGQAGTARQLISPGVARLVTLHLADASARLPSFPRMGNTEYPFPVALKTGSSQGLRDAWTLAYSRHYLIGVWIGHADARPMHEVTGAGNAAELARQVLTLLHRDEQHGTADVSFPRPMGYLPVSICALTGKRATSACDLSFEEWFKPGQEPQQDDDAHLRLGIDIRNGLLAHAGTPARYAELRTFINLPPRYADWSAQNGLPRPPQFVSGFGNQDEFAGQHFFSTRALPVNSSAATSLSAPSLQIVAPVDGLNVLRDPSLPARLNTIALQVDVDPPVPEVLWTIDGKPYQLVSYPYTVRWPLQTGQHLVRAWLPMTTQASPSVRIVVR